MLGIGAVSGPNSAALLTNRDGIVGSWALPETVLPHHPLDDEANIEFWSPVVRATVIDFETYSRMGFVHEPNSDRISVFHLKVAAPTSGRPPETRYGKLVSLVRPSEEVLRKQLDYIRQYADLRTDRAHEILVQIGAAMGFFAPILGLQPDRNKWTIELMAAAQRLAFVVEMRVKHALAVRRPDELSPQLQPIIQTPGHGSLPSGHSTESFTVAATLCRLMAAAADARGADPDQRIRTQLMRQAARIAINRTVAGVHYPVDSVAGAVLGLTLGTYLADRCEVTQHYTSWRFDGSAFPESGDADFVWQDLYDVETGAFQSPVYASTPRERHFGGDQHSAILGRIWTKALEEWT